MASSSQSRPIVTGSTGEPGRLVIHELFKSVPASSIVAAGWPPHHEVAKPMIYSSVRIAAGRTAGHWPPRCPMRGRVSIAA